MKVNTAFLLALASSATVDVASAQSIFGGSGSPFGGSGQSGSGRSHLSSLLDMIRSFLSNNGGGGGITYGGESGLGGIAWPSKPTGGTVVAPPTSTPADGPRGGVVFPGWGSGSGSSSSGGSVAAPNDGSNTAPSSGGRKANLFSRSALDQMINQGFKNKIPSAKIESKNVWTDKIPDTCYQEAKKRNVLNDVTVTEVKYEDCPETWVFCYTKGTPFTEEALMTEFGRVNVGIRQRVRHVMSFPGGGASWANYQNDISMQFLTYSAVLHEAGHGFDDYDTRTAFSVSSAWKSARAADSCVSDSYASTSAAEGWAQTFVVRRFQKEVGELAKDPACMKNQLDTVAQQTDESIAKGYLPERKIPKGRILNRATGQVVNAKRRRDGRLARRFEEKCAGFNPFEEVEEVSPVEY